ncbi:MAG: hypothetical protein QOK29_1847 [Rhodospirillaceae bacterium]|jgi:hypothetical protein|nr:hypothetical protein [Rhodospirillaceae bacterium]
MAAYGFDLYTIAGFLGTAMIVGAYFSNQQGRLRSDDWRYPLLNLIGSCLILVSLYAAWNLPAAVIEIFWAAISVMGLMKHRRRQI